MKPRTPPKLKAQPKPVALTPEEIALVRSLVIYEDADIMALNKPSGLSSQGGRGQVNTLDELLWAFAKPGKARPRLIHRLDRDTSGVILTAKTKPAASFLGKHMMGRRFAKSYRAIVTPGAPEPAGGVIEAALRREEAGREAYMRVCAPDHPDAETALTRYRTLAKGAGAALVEANPQTGRMHQIRVHLASSGHPIAGDEKYGDFERNRSLQKAGLKRMFLHAWRLRFTHPASGEVVQLEQPLEAALAGFVQQAAAGPSTPPHKD